MSETEGSAAGTPEISEKPKSAPKKKRKSRKKKGKTTPVPLSAKPCQECGVVMDPKTTTYRTRTDWEKRKFCSDACKTANSRKNPAKFMKKEQLAAEERLQSDSRAVQEMARRALARKSLLYFTKKTHPKYDPGWVHADICMRLERFSQQVREKKSPRLMLLMPQRHGKSELASIRFPAWYLGQMPDHEIINVGYSLDLPMRWSRKVRELLRDPTYQAIFPTTQIDTESSALEAWLTTAGGGFTAAGVGGGITGKGAHILVVDDPIKNMEEADSNTTRESLWDWFWSTAYTRLAPGGGVLLIQTWWNDDDLAGRLQVLSETTPDADQYEVVKYPALAEAYEYRDVATLDIVRSPTRLHGDDTERLHLEEATSGRHLPVVTETGAMEYLRAPGEALHPARYDAPALGRIKASMLPRVWSALYQQNPVPDEGMLFRKEYFSYTAACPRPEGLNVYQAWDFAIGQKQQNDWTVGATLIHDTTDRLYVAEIYRAKIDAFGIVDAMVNAYLRWGQDAASYLLGVEDGVIWKSIAPLFKRRMQEKSLYIPFEVLKPLNDKLARARPLQGRMQQHNIVFPKDALWLGDCERELLRFPAGAHDDIVDALAWATLLATGKPPPRHWAPPPPKSWKDRLGDLSGSNFNHMGA